VFTDQLLTVAQAAELLNISPRTLYVLVETGRLGHLRVGGAIRFDREELAHQLRVEASR